MSHHFTDQENRAIENLTHAHIARRAIDAFNVETSNTDTGVSSHERTALVNHLNATIRRCEVILSGKTDD